MLSPEQRTAFDETGLLRLPSVFSSGQAAAMETKLWDALARKHGVRREDPESWRIPLGTGLQPLRTHAVFDPIGGDALLGALDELIGVERWQRPKHWGQLLVTFPQHPEERGMRGTWHTDYPYSLPVHRLVGVLVFSFISQVPPRTGGTQVIEGSHRLVERFLEDRPHLREVPMKVARRALMDSDPWLRSIRDESAEPGWSGEIGSREGKALGVPLQVRELTGEPGDVVIAHPWMVHSPAPNRGDRPRLMRVQRIVPAPSRPH